MASELDNEDGKGFLLSGQVTAGKYFIKNVYNGWTDKNDRTLLVRVTLKIGEEPPRFETVPSLLQEESA